MKKELYTIQYENIERMAYQQGMTISMLSDETHMRRSVLSDLKNGRKNQLSPITVRKLCEVLGCTEDDINKEYSGKDPMPDKPQRRQGEPTYDRYHEALKTRPEIRQLVRTAIKATPRQVRATALLLESIIDGSIERNVKEGDDSE